MDSILKQLLTSIKQSIPKQCKTHFDEALDHSLTRYPASDRLVGLPSQQQFSVLENALEITQERCTELSHTHQTIQHICFPAVFAALRQAAKLQPVVRPKQAKDSQTGTDKSQKSNGTKTTKEKPKNTKTKPSSSSAKPAEFNEAKVYSELDAFKTKGHPFRTLSHLKCSSKSCSFCLKLYNSINLTQCEGHKRCVPSGWFPHVGKGLWAKLKASHDAGCEYTAKPVPPKTTERNSLLLRNNVMDTTDSESIITEARTEKSSPKRLRSDSASSDETIRSTTSSCSRYTPDREFETPRNHRRSKSRSPSSIGNSRQHTPNGLGSNKANRAHKQ